MTLKKRFTKKLLVGGLILAATGLILTSTSLLNLYGSANACLEGSSNCDNVPNSTPIATIGGYLFVVGAILFWVGVARVIISTISRKR